MHLYLWIPQNQNADSRVLSVWFLLRSRFLSFDSPGFHPKSVFFFFLSLCCVKSRVYSARNSIFRCKKMKNFCWGKIRLGIVNCNLVLNSTLMRFPNSLCIRRYEISHWYGVWEWYSNSLCIGRYADTCYQYLILVWYLSFMCPAMWAMYIWPIWLHLSGLLADAQLFCLVEVKRCTAQVLNTGQHFWIRISPSLISH